MAKERSTLQQYVSGVVGASSTLGEAFQRSMQPADPAGGVSFHQTPPGFESQVAFLQENNEKMIAQQQAQSGRRASRQQSGCGRTSKSGGGGGQEKFICKRDMCRRCHKRDWCPNDQNKYRSS